MFKDRISGYVQYYNKVSSGLVFAVPQPFQVEVHQVVFTTSGKISEACTTAVLNFLLTGNVIKGKNFDWQVTVNASTLENKITKMPETNKEIISGTKKLSVGHSIYDYWLISYKGVDPANGDALYELDPTMHTRIMPLMTYPDKTINGVQYTTSISRAKYDYHGSAIPDLYGSLRNDFGIKTFH